MGTTSTTNLTLVKPNPFEESDTWGSILNANFDKIDALGTVSAKAIAAVTPTADRLPYFTSGTAATVTPFTAFARTLIDDADAAAMQTTLGLGTGNSPQFAGVNIGHATDTTLTRVSAGVAAIEGKNIALNGTGEKLTTGSIELGNASDTTITRASAGVLAVDGGVIPKEDRANTFTQNQNIQRSDAQSILNITAEGYNSVAQFASYGTAINGAAQFIRYRGTLASPTIVSSGDVMGFLDFRGYDGSTTRSGARITCEVDGTPGASDMPGRLIFSTTSDGGSAAAERMRIDSSGNVSIGTSAVASNTLRYFDLQNIDTGDYAGAIMRFITSNAAGAGNAIVDLVKYKTGGFFINNGETGASGLIAFGVGGTERLRITANGGVSFGSSGTAYGTTGQVLVSQGNAPPVWSNPGAVLLGTLTTTSGTTQTLSSLVLTPYKFLRLVFNGVSGSSNGTFSFGSFQVSQANAGTDAWIGIVDVDLATGIGSANLGEAAGASTPRVGSTGYTTASTSVSLTIGAGTFDAGSVAVYGVA